MRRIPAGQVSVIIVTWNVRELALACLAALERHARDAVLEVIVVDNASTDDTVAAVLRDYPGVRVIANTENVGFPIANNQALRLVRGEYVLFLNPDTEVGPNAVQTCVEELEHDATVGMVGCKLLLEDGRTQLECARRPYLLRHLVGELLYLHMLFPESRIGGDHLLGYWDHEGVRDVEAICGAYMLARTAAVRAVGGLPDEIFMYHEDLALCLLLQRAGWRIRYRGDVSTLHRWQRSSAKSAAPLALLEGVCKVRLIRDAQGELAGIVARGLFAIRCALRLGLALMGHALPLRTLRDRYPRVFDARTHALQLAWAVAPFTVAKRIPRTRAANRPAQTAVA